MLSLSLAMYCALLALRLVEFVVTHVYLNFFLFFGFNPSVIDISRLHLRMLFNRLLSLKCSAEIFLLLFNDR